MRTGRVFVLVFVALLISAGTVGAAPATTSSTRQAFVAPLSGQEEVPPRATPAVGLAGLGTNRDGTELSYFLAVVKIENVVAAHIHLGAKGTNGPVVAFLYGPVPPGGGKARNLLAADTLTASDLVGPLAGQPLSALLAQMIAGNAYVNVHTNDGVAPPDTGPGDFPGGEIRGQIKCVAGCCC